MKVLLCPLLLIGTKPSAACGTTGAPFPVAL